MQDNLEFSVHSAGIIQTRFCQETKKNITVFCAKVSCLPKRTRPPGEKMTGRSYASSYLHMHESAKEA